MLPSAVRMIDKLTGIINDRMQTNLKAPLVSLSSLSSQALWERTDRWNNSELFKLKDSKNSGFCLVATCEEDITELMRDYITSYKDMPTIVYQIGKKYRDELRPRSGLLRSREFIMMDAYSFSSTDQDAMKMFNDTNETFLEIFQALKVPVVRAWADSGDIGGDLSIEYHLPLETGESTIVSCNNEKCKHVATDEKALSFPKIEGQSNGDIAVKYGLCKDHSTLFCFYYPKDRQLNWNLALKSVENDIDSTLRYTKNNEIIDFFQNENEDMMFAKVLRVMDCRINSQSNFPDFPLRQYLKNNFGQINDVSLVNAIDDELCGVCNEGTLTSAKSIEVAHTFNLDTKYTKPLNLKFMDKDNNANVLVKMGCYGIGITRIIASVAELTRDKHGLRWPSAIAPQLVSVCTAPGGKTKDIYAKVLKQLKDDPLLKKEIMSNFHESTGLGSRISISHAMGIPLTIIIGKKSWPKIEIEVRSKRWDESKIPQWEESYPNLKDEFQWEVIPGKPEDPIQEKHIVAHEHANELIHMLLKDL